MFGVKRIPKEKKSISIWMLWQGLIGIHDLGIYLCTFCLRIVFGDILHPFDPDGGYLKRDAGGPAGHE